MKTDLSLAEARRIALAAQGLAQPDRAGAAAWPRLAKALSSMGLLQIDSVNVLCRSHYLPLFSRVGSYAQSALDARTFGAKQRHFFEYWAHEASFLPLALYPLLRWKMQRARRGDGNYRHMSRWGLENRAYVEAVRAEVAARGPLNVAGLADPGPRNGSWWGWSKGKYALEYLFDTGELAAATRAGFERIYDLAERVIPAAQLDAPVPAEADAIRALVEMSARHHGIATETDLRDYFRLPLLENRRAVAELVEDGRLVPVVVAGWARPAYVHSAAKLPRSAGATALFSPFDPLVWERGRTERLFGLRYRLEIYTPQPKRVYGYYVLPFLMGDRFCARVCLKADRQAGVLRVNAAHLEEAAPAGETAAALAAELIRMAQWLGLGGVAVASGGTLAKALAGAVHARHRSD